MKGKEKMAKRVYNTVLTVLIAIIVILAILLAGIRLFGYIPFTVLSGSMEPTYHVGSMIYVKETDTDSLKVGDPVTFYLDDGKTVATHRIIEIDKENKTFKTQGDANETPDASPVDFASVIGTPKFTIPNLGYFYAFISGVPGRYIAIAALVVIILLSFLSDLIWPSDKSKQ